MHKTLLAMLATIPIALHAQGAAQGAAQASIPPADEQIAAAVLPLPGEMRASATVMGYRTAGKLEVLREGKNGMHCLALYVTRQDFHVACYHDSLEPFMARGRELREKGVTAQAAVDSVRFAEIKSGRLKMPAAGALYSLTGPRTGWDATKRTMAGANPLGVIYMPFATPETTGISANPATKGPWLMFPGTAKAHVMVAGGMQ